MGKEDALRCPRARKLWLLAHSTALLLHRDCKTDSQDADHSKDWLQISLGCVPRIFLRQPERRTHHASVTRVSHGARRHAWRPTPDWGISRQSCQSTRASTNLMSKPASSKQRDGLGDMASEWAPISPSPASASKEGHQSGRRKSLASLLLGVLALPALCAARETEEVLPVLSRESIQPAYFRRIEHVSAKHLALARR